MEKRDELLNRYKNYKKGKRVKLDSVTVYNIKQILEIAREKKAKKKFISPKRSRGRPRKRPIKELKEENKNKNLKTLFSDSDIILNKNMNRKTRARKAI